MPNCFESARNANFTSDLKTVEHNFIITFDATCFPRTIFSWSCVAHLMEKPGMRKLFLMIGKADDAYAFNGGFATQERFLHVDGMSPQKLHSRRTPCHLGSR